MSTIDGTGLTERQYGGWNLPHAISYTLAAVKVYVDGIDIISATVAETCHTDRISSTVAGICHT